MTTDALTITTAESITTDGPTTTTNGSTTTPSQTIPTDAQTTTAKLTAITAAPTTTMTEPTTIKTAATTPTAAPTSNTAVPATPTAAPTTTVAAPTTTKVPPSTPTVALSTTTTTTEAPPPVFVLIATLVQPFVQELSDTNSQQFKELEKQVVVVFDIIYRARYGLLFIRSFVIAFRPAVAGTRSDNTEVEVGVEFNKTASAAEIPATKQVQETLMQAVTNVSTNFNITFESNSIQVIRTPFTNSTTAAPISNSTATANDTTATAATTTAITATTTLTATTTNSTATANSTTAITSITAVIDTSTTSTTTISTTTIATTTTVEAITTRRVTFRSAGETFTIDLANPSSQAFTNRAELLKSTLKPLYQNTFASFRSLTVVSFSNGSIINNMDLGFASTSLPSNTQIANVLIKAASNITAFNIDINNISVDGSQVSSGVSHKINLIAASCMVLLSWLLSSQQ
ncbi:mucin-5AC-like [Melanotaenia boesemani]|uniref:mucin-5AC-like n=1 Tax=Melanotaenia boesemani TaxID=1250792 RepID=UPI001C04E82F|nr:mucin-5AC-like [Melanotaenia boesemani]XP_041840338.1 mucin-5AC-like [Melanotaenia boesemani]